jgi:hypothetical protein
MVRVTMTRRQIISDTYALKRRGDAISFQILSAHFSNQAQSTDDPRDRFGFEPRYGAGFETIHRAQDIQHIWKTGRENDQLVSMKKNITNKIVSDTHALQNQD